MKLVFIYGPPAVGKLSVARELSRMTGYRLFHNHASLDFVGSIFDFGTSAFNRLVVKYREEMLEEAAKAGINTIFTSAWIKGYDPRVIGRVVRLIDSHGGKVCFVYLYCAMDELLKRVGKDKRRVQGKLADRRQLRDYLYFHKPSSKAPIRGSLTIDNTRMSPRSVAKAIIRRYRLPRLDSRAQGARRF